MFDQDRPAARRHAERERKRVRSRHAAGQELERVVQLVSYERLDAAMLAWARDAGDFAFEDGRRAGDASSTLASAGSFWLESAKLRGLIDAHDDGAHDGRSFTLSPAGAAWLVAHPPV